ncbi:MAG: energy-coupling factor transporter transmembrane protein EcfT [Anaerolineae bacterium]|nr:energy-coupling factor transporter transmembrane protein EcfT [Anaerolineae bacterium]
MNTITGSASRPQTGYPFQAKTWTLWLLAALTPAILTKNPLYLLLLIAVVWLNYFSLDPKTATARGWRAFLYLGVVLALVSVVFNILFVRAGATHLFTLPKLQWQTTTEMGYVTVAQIGGKVTLESLVYGLNTGLALMTILLIFATFNTQVDHYQLLRSTPRFLYQSAIVMSIAITFIPYMLIAQREIREAQTLRGHRFRRIRDLLPLFVTLLAEGLERSLVLAESMEARGFSSPPPGQTVETGLRLKGCIALALTILLGGAFAWNYAPQKIIGGTMMLAGGTMLAMALWLVGRKVRRSRYRRALWRRQDTVVAVTAMISLSVILANWLTNRSILIFYPYPKLQWPPFSPMIALSLLLLATPVLIQWWVNLKKPGRSVEFRYD